MDLGAMVPSTLSQPPETTVAITLRGEDLIKIMAKDGKVQYLPGNGNVESLKDRPVTALHWLVFIHPQQACISPTYGVKIYGICLNQDLLKSDHLSWS